MDYKIVKRLIFKHYNRARNSGVLDEKRVNRALGIALSKTFTEKMKQYGTTKTTCYCPDSEHRAHWCKHKIAFWINWYVWMDYQDILTKEMFYEHKSIEDRR